MRRFLLVGLTLLALAACRRSERDQGSGLVPPAAAPASPGEPASAPAALTAAAPDFDAAIDAAGTEPFWSLKIRRDSLQLSRPDHLDLLAVNPGPQMDGLSAEWRATTTRGVLVRVTLKPGDCMSAGSGKHMPYRAAVMVGDELLEGCAGPVQAPVGPAAAVKGEAAPAALPPSAD